MRIEGGLFQESDVLMNERGASLGIDREVGRGRLMMSGVLLRFACGRIRRSWRPKVVRREVKRLRPRPVLPMAMNGLPNMIENAQAWKLSVTMYSASMNPRSHASTGGWMRCRGGRLRSSTGAVTLNGVRCLRDVISDIILSLKGVGSRM